jgi:hypothetical protein
MDAQHAQIMEQVGRGILQQALVEEKKLDAKLKDLENLGNDVTNSVSLFSKYILFR